MIVDKIVPAVAGPSIQMAKELASISINIVVLYARLIHNVVLGNSV